MDLIVKQNDMNIINESNILFCERIYIIIYVINFFSWLVYYLYVVWKMLVYIYVLYVLFCVLQKFGSVLYINKGLYEFVLYGIVVKFNIWMMDFGVQMSLSYLYGCLFILNGFFEQFDVFFYIEDFLENLLVRWKKKCYMKYFVLKNM